MLVVIFTFTQSLPIVFFKPSVILSTVNSFLKFSDQSSIGSDSHVTPPVPTTEGKKIRSSKELYLMRSDLGENGNLLSDFTKPLGNNPSMEIITLWQYSMPERKWAELLQFSSKCKNLRKLELSYNTIGEAGYCLTQSITLIPSLRHLGLIDCSIPEQVWIELLQSLSSCKLSHLDLSENTIGEAGCFLAQSIALWKKSPLRELNLSSCSIPEQVWIELLQSLSSCKLSHLDLSENTIGEAGHFLAQSIALWKNSPLRELNLSSCSIPEQVWIELLQSLSSYKLSHLDLSGNTIGEAGRFLAQSIALWKNSPLCELNLSSCSIPEQVWIELLQSLSSYKLSHLDLSENTISEVGRFLAQSIALWKNSPLCKLDLWHISIPEQVWTELFQSLSSCQQLRHLYLGGNTVTGCLSSFLSDPHPGLTHLLRLNLPQTAMNKSDLKHLTNLIQNNKLPCLEELFLGDQNCTDAEDELKQLIEVCEEKSGLELNLKDKIVRGR